MDLLADVPRHELAAQAVRDAMAQADQPVRPLRIAVPVDLKLPLAAGRWQSLGAGQVHWRVRLASPGARTLSAHLAPLVLPPGAQLWIHGARGEVSYGPYTAANVTAQGFWTPVVPADEMVLEVRAPVADAPAVRLQVAEAFHGTQDFGKASGGPGASGSCNVDAACETDTWGAEIRSVAHVIINGQYLCSGQLVNNVLQDQTPLFLTARHCGINRERGSAESVNFYFNYQGSCGGSPPPLPSVTVTGSTFLADDVPSDFALVRLNGAPPSNATFAGWDVTGGGSSSGASIHHPSGDEKKISLFSSPVTPAGVDIGSACTIDSWEVHWSSGTTEGGSSGGGLWTTSHQLIGVLSGGTASCQNPNGSDYYGRLDKGWTPSTARDNQLKAHLDPNGSCIAAVPMLDPAATKHASPVTSGPTRCEGDAGVCVKAGGHDDHGGPVPEELSLLLVLAAALRRRRPR